MKVLAFPRDRNPYQSLLYGAMADHGVSVSYAGQRTPSHTLNLLLLPLDLLVGRLRGVRVVHLHWVYPFRLPVVGDRGWARRLCEAWFRLCLGLARLLGTRLVWTAHNVLPHEPVFLDDAAARAALVRSCDLVIAHNEATIAALADLGITPRRSTVIPHGPFDLGAPAAAPDATRDRRTLLFFGAVSEYKGVEDLLAVASGLRDVDVVVAGECVDPALRARVEAAAGPGTRLRLARVPDDEVAELMAAADAVVLPFRRVTTSGSALLSLGYGKPLIVPDLPALADLPDGAVLRYPAGSRPGLAAALARFARLDPSAVAGMSAAAAAHGTGWPEIAARTIAALGELPPRDGMLRDSAHLFANTVALSLFGFAFWTLAARLYPSADVGRFSAAVASATLLTAFATLGLPYAIARFLPAARHRRELLLAMVLAVLVVGGAVGGGVLFLGGLVESPALAAAVLGLVVVSAVSAVLDSGLLARKAAAKVLTKSIAGGLVKLVALVAVAGLGVVGLTASYALGAAVAAALALVRLWRLLPGERTRWRDVRLRREHLSFSSASYLGNVFGVIPSTVVPILVLGVLGAQTTAWLSMAFLLVGFLNFIPSAVSQALFAHAARDPGGLAARRRKAMKAVFALLTPGVVVLVAIAPVLLSVFGPEYVAATTATRVLAVGALVSATAYVIDAALIAQNRKVAFVAVNGVNALLVVVAVVLTAHHGLTAVALGWAGAQVVSVLVALAVDRRVFHRLTAPVLSGGRRPSGSPTGPRPTAPPPCRGAIGGG
ncbi:glycosyltransferase [Actinokineospora auranticolor]|uniref:O-antigen/teichoic acid export membrane protein n=1 Tax=Actinokineospora auranticolor TaxID=155976 RepID=A0A2S6GQ54_9PSEU|nr:glycosyltransferase [Actinokineospora auranticolor]PPK67349.1 O-antigen/teichoic acid export membrane protein [Actinokineospora auranticolor]